MLRQSFSMLLLLCLSFSLITEPALSARRGGGGGGRSGGFSRSGGGNFGGGGGSFNRVNSNVNLQNRGNINRPSNLNRPTQLPANNNLGNNLGNRQGQWSQNQGNRQDVRLERQGQRTERQGNRQDNRTERQGVRQSNRTDRQGNRQDFLDDNWNNWGRYPNWNGGWYGRGYYVPPGWGAWGVATFATGLAIGATVNSAPPYYDTIYVSNSPYIYSDGIYMQPSGSSYVVVAPPQGAVVTYLPDGCTSTNQGNTQYFDCSGVIYQPFMQNGSMVYQVVKY